MRVRIQLNPDAEKEQRAAVKAAMDSFLGFEEFLLSDYTIEGSFLYVLERGEYWFFVRFKWADQLDTVSWCHVFADLAEFDRLSGSPDPEASFGFRAADSLDDIFEGKFE